MLPKPHKIDAIPAEIQEKINQKNRQTFQSQTNLKKTSTDKYNDVSYLQSTRKHPINSLNKFK